MFQQIAAMSMRDGLGSVIFTASFIAVIIGVAIWWLRRDA